MEKSTKTLLHKLIQTTLSPQSDVLKLSSTKDKSKKQSCNRESSSLAVACNGKDDASQYSDDNGSNSTHPLEVEDHKSSDNAEHFKLLEGAESSLRLSSVRRWNMLLGGWRLPSMDNQIPGGLGVRNSAR